MKKRWELLQYAPIIAMSILFLIGFCVAPVSVRGDALDSSVLRSNNSRPTISITFDRNTTVPDTPFPLIFPVGVATQYSVQSQKQSDLQWSFAPSAALASTDPAGTAYRLLFTGIDQYLNNKSYTVNFFVDLIAPNVVVTPSSGLIWNAPGPLLMTLQSSEQSALIHASLESNGVEQDITPLFQTSDNEIFSSSQVLPDGIYLFSYALADLAGNSRSGSTTFVVNANPLSITALSPALNVTSQNPFTFLFTTSKNATCRYSLTPTTWASMGAIVESNGTYHSKNFTFSPGFSAIPLAILCRGDSGVFSPTSLFTIQYDATPVTITSVTVTPNNGAFPFIVNEHLDQAKLWVFTDDESRCTYDNAGGVPLTLFSDSYAAVNSISLAGKISDSSNYSYSVQCTNKAGNSSEVKTLNFSVNLNADATINVANPAPVTNSPQVLLNVTTTQTGTCSYHFNQLGSYVNLGTSDGRTHTTQTPLALADGDYSLQVSCIFPTKTASITYPFVVDTAPPSIPNISFTSDLCDPHTISASFSASDTLSGIATYNTTLSNTTGVISTSIGSSFQYTNQEGLIPGAPYTISVIAQDRAGNSGEVGSATLVPLDPDSLSCQRPDDVPTINITVQNTTGGTLVEVECIPGRNTPLLSFIYGTSTPGTACIANIVSKCNASFLFNTSTLFCYKIPGANRSFLSTQTLLLSGVASSPAQNGHAENSTGFTSSAPNATGAPDSGGSDFTSSNSTASGTPPAGVSGFSGISLALLLLGAFLILLGAGYLVYAQFIQKKEEAAPLPTIATQTGSSPVLLPASEAMQERFEEREKEKENERKEIFSSFDSGLHTGNSQRRNPLLRIRAGTPTGVGLSQERANFGLKKSREFRAKQDALRITRALFSKPDAIGVLKSVDEGVPGQDDHRNPALPTHSSRSAAEYIDLEELQNGKKQRKQSSDVFSTLATISSSAVPEKESRRMQENQTQKTQKKEISGKNKSSDVPQQVSVARKSTPGTRSNPLGSDPFEALSELIGVPAAETRKLSNKESVTSADLLSLFEQSPAHGEIFSNAPAPLKISAEAFQIILSQLLSSGKIQKKDVTNILFELMDKQVLSAQQVAKIMNKLGFAPDLQ